MTKPRQQKLPAPVRQALIDAGKLDIDTITRKARLRTCRHCGARVVTGLDNEPCGIPTRADPTPLNPTAEYIALTQGRTTYDLIPGPHLQYRDDFRIRDPHQDHPVLPDHRCRPGRVPLRIDPAVLDVLDPSRRYPTHNSDTPPF